MTGYEPIELRKLMRKRLTFYVQSRVIKNKVIRKTVSGLLDEINEKITDFVNSPYNNVNPYWRNKALETINRGKSARL